MSSALSRFVDPAYIEERYGMPRTTQKDWRRTGRFVEGRDYRKIGYAIIYDEKSLAKNEAFKKYIEEKK